VDALKREETSVLRSPLRARPRAPRAESAHAHGEEAYSDRAGREGALPFGLVMIAVLLWWSADQGGYAPTTWYPGALLFLGLLAVVAVSPSRRGRPSPRAWAAIALLAAFTGWSFLSISWAGVQGDAWDGANRTLLYAVVYATFALLMWRPPEAVLMLGLFALGVAAIGGIALATEGADAFNGNRLAEPTGYENASAALFLMAFWPAVALAARPEVHWAARSLLLATGGLLLQLALLAQSRGSLVAGGIALLVLVLVSRDRLRLAAVLLLVAAAVAATLLPLLDVVTAGSEAEVRQAVGAERVAIALSTLALLLVGGLIYFVGQTGRVRRSRPQFESGKRVAAVVTVGLALVALCAAALASTLGDAPRPGLETGRYDMWRVAAGEVADRPLLGVGVDNFAVDFVRERSTGEEPLYPHSLVLRAFSQAGLIGGTLFLGFVAAALAAAVPRRQEPDSLGRAIAAAALASGVYWLVHGSIDWLWEIPALGVSALALLGLASSLARSTPRDAVRARARSAPVLAGAAALLAVAAASFVFPGLAALELERGVRAWPDSPDRALSQLERAHRLNPLSERADVVAGTLALRDGDTEEARAAFQRALDRNPHDWYVHLQLALLAEEDGQSAVALAHLERARSLNPRELLVLGDPSESAVRGPLGRRPVDCRPVLGLESGCNGSGR
jgi:tetratricopeptide (TPR) repeat protein